MWSFYIAFNGLVLAESRPPTGDELVAAVDEFNRTARFPLPSLDEDGQQTLLAGDVWRLLERSTIPGEASRAVGLVLTDVPRNQVWVSCQDLHFAQNEKVAEAMLHSSNVHEHTWFGLLDLPAPFSDRYWVVDVLNNDAMAVDSGNRAWEHSWELNARGEEWALEAAGQGLVPQVTQEQVQEAVYTPKNQGAWLIMDLPGGYSLFGYHTSTELAGKLPTNLVLQFVHAQLGSMLGDLVERARTVVPDHYGSNHVDPVIGGDGEAVPRWE